MSELEQLQARIEQLQQSIRMLAIIIADISYPIRGEGWAKELKKIIESIPSEETP